MFFLLQCWYEGDSNLVGDSFVAAATTTAALIAVAEARNATDIYMPGEAVPDDGNYGDERRRYRICEAVSERGVLVPTEAPAWHRPERIPWVPLTPINYDLLHSEWFTPNVVQLTRQIYETRAFDQMPILADALQDAGCDYEELLTQMRGNRRYWDWGDEFSSRVIGAVRQASNVTNMASMFANCSAFNQSVAGFNIPQNTYATGPATLVLTEPFTPAEPQTFNVKLETV